MRDPRAVFAIDRGVGAQTFDVFVRERESMRAIVCARACAARAIEICDLLRMVNFMQVWFCFVRVQRKFFFR